MNSTIAERVTDADSLAILRYHAAAILRHLARTEAARLGKLAGMAEQARTPEDIRVIFGTAARGAQAVAPGRPDWQARTVYLFGELEGAVEPDVHGCCHPDEPCPHHGLLLEAAAFAVALGRAVKEADSPEDAGMRIAEILAGGAR